MDDKDAFIKVSVDQLMRAEASSRKEEEAAHRLAREYGPVLDSFNDVVFITDKAGHFVFVNKASEQRTGIPTEAFIGLHYLEIIESQYQEFARNSFQKAMRGDRAAPAIEMERQTATGETVTLEINWKVLSEDSVAVGLLAVSRDVTDRKQAQEALKKARDELEMRVKERTAELQKANEMLKEQIKERIRAEEKLKESEEKYRGLFENSGDAIFLVDIDTGIILDANRQAESLTGRSRQELIGMHQSRLHAAQEANYYEEKFRKHIKNELVFDLEAEVINIDGSVVPVFICSNLIDLPGKKVVQEIIRDISKEMMISDLKGELAAKKVINRAKTIIANHYGFNDSDAMRLLQKESRKQSRKLKEVAQAVVSSKFIMD
jgi:PAS domain S-box-containing protein